jgi:nitrogen fixation-related uncharacterized protein
MLKILLILVGSCILAAGLMFALLFWGLSKDFKDLGKD